MSVRAKFFVESVRDNFGGPNMTDVTQRDVKLKAVYGDDNKDWSKWTPSGELTMSITNPAAYEQFVGGKVFFIDFSEVPPKE